MNKTNNIFKATVVIVIALALLVPGAAMAANTNTPIIKNTPYTPLTRDGGWTEQASGFWEASRGIRYLDAVTEDIAWAIAYDGSGGNTPINEFTRTINGGDLWEADDVIGGNTYGLGNICGIDGDTAWVAPGFIKRVHYKDLLHLQIMRYSGMKTKECVKAT